MRHARHSLTDHLKWTATGYPEGFAQFEVDTTALKEMEDKIADAQSWIGGPQDRVQAFLCITKSDKEDGKSAYTAWTAYLTRPTDDAPIFTWSTTPTKFKVDNAVDPQPDIESKIDELIELCLQPDPRKPSGKCSEVGFRKRNAVRVGSRQSAERFRLKRPTRSS